MKKKLLLVFIFFMIHNHCANAQEIDIKRIISIESSGNTLAYNKNSNARGLCQITPICLKEYNQYNKTHYTERDLFNPDINIMIANWYFNVRIPQMLKHFKISITTENIIIAYNAGINTLVKHKKLKKETKSYLVKYEQR